MIKGIMFDFDMTLVDSRNIGLKVRRLLLKNHGIISEGLLEKDMYGMNYISFAKNLERLNLGKIGWEKISELDTKYMLESFNNIKIVRKNVLKRLKKSGLKLGIVSGNRSKVIEIVLKNNGIFDSFDFILCSEGEFEGKDKNILICEGVKKWGFLKNEVIYVGDHNHDVDSAKSAGVVSVAITTGLVDQNGLMLSKPDHIIKDLKEIVDIAE